MKKVAFAVLAGTAVLAFSTIGASAAYVCSDNVCWVVKEKYEYPKESKVVIREESWKPSASITIREAGPGRGYYKGTTWTTW